MPLFMDVHYNLPAEADGQAVADAHAADLRVQDKYHTRYLNYWLDEDTRTVFCLVDAPDAESAHAVHREAHGLVADAIHKVQQG